MMALNGKKINFDYLSSIKSHRSYFFVANFFILLSLSKEIQFFQHSPFPASLSFSLLLSLALKRSLFRDIILLMHDYAFATLLSSVSV